MGLSQGWLELLMTCIDCTTYSAITSCTMSGSWQYLIISFLRYIPPKIGSQYFGHLYFYFLLFFPLFYSSPACSVFPYEEQLRPKAVTTICNLLQPHHPRSHPKKRYNSGSIKNTKKKKKLLTSFLLCIIFSFFIRTTDMCSCLKHICSTPTKGPLLLVAEKWLQPRQKPDLPLLGQRHLATTAFTPEVSSLSIIFVAW